MTEKLEVNHLFSYRSFEQSNLKRELRAQEKKCLPMLGLLLSEGGGLAPASRVAVWEGGGGGSPPPVLENLVPIQFLKQEKLL